MKKLILLSILLLSISVVYTQTKPCCKNKAKSGITCKNAQANTETAINTEEASSSDQVTSKPCSTSKSCCNKTGKSPWWKFWSKKSDTTCCNAPDSGEATDKQGVSNNIKGKVFVPAYTDHSTGCNSY
ncbi:MAG: hypothetical protein QF472_02290 [Candidatus Marinimicrobia bacterium]|nr:hypothetical protein [Candidatus Neomarinimicrobiota bacterium]